MGLNRIDKFGQGHLCLREENLSFINNYIIRVVMALTNIILWI
jgi:hypothetical protein